MLGKNLWLALSALNLSCKVVLSGCVQASQVLPCAVVLSNFHFVIITQEVVHLCRNFLHRWHLYRVLC